jgi:hypothetical protein
VGDDGAARAELPAVHGLDFVHGKPIGKKRENVAIAGNFRTRCDRY